MTSNAEIARLDALRRLNLLDTPPSESFDRITRMATQIFGLPIAAVSLTDSDRQWFKSRVGVEHRSIPRDRAPCAEVADTAGVLVIEDLLDDPCYGDCTLSRAGIRFYAGSPLVTKDGHRLGAMCVLGTEPRTTTEAERSALKDLAAMVMAQVEMQHAFGRIDPISELPNRTQFVDDLDDLSLDGGRGGRRTAVLFDLIGVSQLNHAVRVMGPGAVDEMVRLAARNLTTMIGPGGKAYHVGTTQLLTLSQDGPEEDAYVTRLRDGTERLRDLLGTGSIGAPVAGMAPFAVGETSPMDVLRTAQGAAQDARSSGRVFQVHSARLDNEFRRSFTLLRDFEAALEEDAGQFRLVYQPRIDLASGRCVGAEALMRWDHPTLGPISPGEFIPLVEVTAMAGPTTAWVLDTAAAQMARWRRTGLDLVVSVNVSSANLHDIGFATRVKAVVARHGIDPETLELEVTETAVMHDPETALAQLRALRDAGIRLAIDDFGTGYSSLSYLQKLPVQVVKIDRSFIGALDVDDRQRSLVGMMVTMAKHLGHRVVAEGVETPGILGLVRSAGCDEAQGYHFSPPMKPDAFVEWLAQMSGDALGTARKAATRGHRDLHGRFFPMK